MTTAKGIPLHLFTALLVLCCPRPSLETDNLYRKIDLKPNAPYSVHKHERLSVPQKFVNELEEKAYFALKYLHHQMDDDHSGNVDLQESDEFIREELNNAHGGPNRQEKFHQNDFHISVQELWFSFKKSPLYNWTADDVAQWLQDHVDLPQYAPLFRAKGISGLHLPRLAANQDHYFTKTMGRFPPEVKRKIILKATDAVIFGPPSATDAHSLFKDLVLVAAIVLASVCAWMADTRSKKSQRDIGWVKKKFLLAFSALSKLPTL